MVYSMKMKNKEFLSICEFADIVGIHPNTVRNMIKSGRLCAFRTGSSEKSSYRIAKSEIQRLSIVDLDKIIESLIEDKK
jgi:excisionase family DNA binding protein